MKSKLIGSIIAGAIVIGGLFGTVSCTTKIPAGYVGVIYDMSGGVENKVLTQGWHIVSPAKHVTKYSVATTQAFLSKDPKEGSKDDNSFMIPTSDGKTVNVDLEFAYHFDSDKAPQTYTRFAGEDGKNIEETFIRGKMKAWSQEVSANFSVLDIYGSKRAELNKAVFDHVKKNFAEYGVVIDSVNFSRIGLDDQTEKAIQARINAQQELEKSKIEKQKAEIDAQKAIVEANGKAEVTRVGAEAEAKANQLKQSTLNDTIVKYEAVKKWDGKLPTYSGMGNSMIQLPTESK